MIPHQSEAHIYADKCELHFAHVGDYIYDYVPRGNTVFRSKAVLTFDAPGSAYIPLEPPRHGLGLLIFCMLHGDYSYKWL